MANNDGVHFGGIENLTLAEGETQDCGDLSANLGYDLHSTAML